MIQIQKLYKTYKNNDLPALAGIDLNIPNGSIVGIIGMSGAGKSTLLKAIALLEAVDSGSIYFDDIDITTLNNKQQRRFRSEIGVVFQGFHLLMQRNVYENIAFPLRMQKYPKKDIDKIVKELIALVGLSGKEKTYPSKLSGGQMQRVAIARSLATNPKLLLLDEFTSALDPITTKQIIELVKKIHREYQMTIIVITHEMAVVKSICEHVAIINYGIIEEYGLVNEIFQKPEKMITKLLLGEEVV